MTLYNNIDIVITVITIIVGTILLGGGIALCEKFEYQNAILQCIGAVVAIISGVIGGFALIGLAICLIGSVGQRHCEPVTYQEYVVTQETLQQAIDNSEDIVNTDLYLRAIDFNADLASIQKAQTDSRYSISFSGEVDWNKIPLIDLE